MNQSSLHIRPFRALRPRPDLVAQVSAVPYDVVSREEAAALAQNNPLSFLRVSKAEIELPGETSPHADAVYDLAAANFKTLIAQGALLREAVPSFYLYRLRHGSHSQQGLVVCCSAADYDAGIIKKHENTRRDKEDDRTRLASTIQAHGGLVFLTYRDLAELTEGMSAVEQFPPLYDFADHAGVNHTVWQITQTEFWEKAFKKVSSCYIADGHHRAAAAARIARCAASQCKNSNNDSAWFPAVLFPAGQLRVMPYNRCVRDLNGLRPSEFIHAIKARTTIQATTQAMPQQAGWVNMFLAGQWYAIELPAPKFSDATTELDVSRLQSDILDAMLGITDPRSDQRLEFIGGIRGTQTLEQLVNSGEYAVAFSMYPVTIQQLMRIADSGMIMPPKSTWFEPKIRSGLLIHQFG